MSVTPENLPKNSTTFSFLTPVERKSKLDEKLLELICKEKINNNTDEAQATLFLQRFAILAVKNQGLVFYDLVLLASKVTNFNLAADALIRVLTIDQVDKLISLLIVLEYEKTKPNNFDGFLRGDSLISTLNAREARYEPSIEIFFKNHVVSSLQQICNLLSQDYREYLKREKISLGKLVQDIRPDLQKLIVMGEKDEKLKDQTQTFRQAWRDYSEALEQGEKTPEPSNTKISKTEYKPSEAIEAEFLRIFKDYLQKFTQGKLDLPQSFLGQLNTIYAEFNRDQANMDVIVKFVGSYLFLRLISAYLKKEQDSLELIYKTDLKDLIIKFCASILQAPIQQLVNSYGNQQNAIMKNKQLDQLSQQLYEIVNSKAIRQQIYDFLLEQATKKPLPAISSATKPLIGSSAAFVDAAQPENLEPIAKFIKDKKAELAKPKLEPIHSPNSNPNVTVTIVKKPEEIEKRKSWIVGIGERAVSNMKKGLSNIRDNKRDSQRNSLPPSEEPSVKPSIYSPIPEIPVALLTTPSKKESPSSNPLNTDGIKAQIKQAQIKNQNNPNLAPLGRATRLSQPEGAIKLTGTPPKPVYQALSAIAKQPTLFQQDPWETELQEKLASLAKISELENKKETFKSILIWILSDPQTLKPLLSEKNILAIAKQYKDIQGSIDEELPTLFNKFKGDTHVPPAVFKLMWYLMPKIALETLDLAINKNELIQMVNQELQNLNFQALWPSEIIGELQVQLQNIENLVKLDELMKPDSL